MRNSENIVNSSLVLGISKEDKTMKSSLPEKTVIGPCNYFYDNCIHQLEHDVLARAVINKYFYNKDQEPIVILLDDDIETDEIEKFYEKIKFSFTDRKVVLLPDTVMTLTTEYDTYLDEVEEFLERPVGILITKCTSFNGAQARNTIILRETTDYPPTRNSVLRTLSFSIVIFKGLEARSAPGMVEDTDLHEHLLSKTSSTSYSYENKLGLDQCSLVTAAINKYGLIDNSNLIILTLEDNKSFEDIIKSNSRVKNILFCSFDSVRDKNSSINLTLSKKSRKKERKLLQKIKCLIESRQTLKMVNTDFLVKKPDNESSGEGYEQSSLEGASEVDKMLDVKFEREIDLNTIHENDKDSSNVEIQKENCNSKMISQYKIKDVPMDLQLYKEVRNLGTQVEQIYEKNNKELKKINKQLREVENISDSESDNEEQTNNEEKEKEIIDSTSNVERTNSELLIMRKEFMKILGISEETQIEYSIYESSGEETEEDSETEIIDSLDDKTDEINEIESKDNTLPSSGEKEKKNYDVNNDASKDDIIDYINQVLAKEQGYVIVFNMEPFFSFNYDEFSTGSNSILVFSKNDYGSTYDIFCRNLLLDSDKNKFFMLIHDGNMDKFGPYLPFKLDESLHQYLPAAGQSSGRQMQESNQNIQ